MQKPESGVNGWPGTRQGRLILQRGSDLHLVTVARDQIRGLLRGGGLDGVKTWFHKTIALSDLRRLDLNPNDRRLTLCLRAGETEKKLVFHGKKGISKFCSQLAERLGWQESRADLSFGDAIAGPVALALVTPILTLFLAAAAVDPAANSGTTGSLRTRGAEKLMSLLGSLTGPTGAFVLGSLVFLGCLVVAYRRARNRPQRTIWKG